MIGYLRRRILGAAAVLLGVLFAGQADAAHLRYGWQNVDGVNLFYREGGPADAPTLVLLHGTPASSIMYEAVMENLVETRGLHVIAMDYPSYGYSEAPDRRAYKYDFDNLAHTVGRFLALKGIGRYALYMQDYGVPIGFRLIEAAPKSITAIIVQNGVIHMDGFPAAQDPDSELRRHWRDRNPEVDQRGIDDLAKLAFPTAANWTDGPNVSPDAILLMTASEQRPGVPEARNDLWYDYGSNLARYPAWQQLLKSLPIPVLVLWGSRDPYFTTPGALAYLRDAPQAEIHILDAGHFATLELPDPIAALVGDFARRHDLR